MTDPVADLAVTDIDTAVRTVIARQLDVPADGLTDRTTVALNLDEAARPRLLRAMGEALDATLPDDFLDGLTTVHDLTSAVRVSLHA